MIKTTRPVWAPLAVAALATLLSACGGGSSSPTPPATATDFVAEASDFECLKNWERVRNMRITNRLGYLDEALELARNPEPGREFPIGTIVQLFPGEAMVKRGPDFDPDNHNW